MIPTAKDMNVGVWKKDNISHYDSWTLKIQGSPIMIGHANDVGAGLSHSKGMISVVARLSNISGDMSKLIPYPCPISDIHKAWEECMDDLLKKLFV